MKKTLLTVVLLSSILTVNGQPNITDLIYSESVPLFQLFEISFKLDSYSNPYDPDTISVYAVFTGPGNRCDTVIGFYYEGYTFQRINGYEHAFREVSENGTGWRIRFTPDATGFWYFCIHAIDHNGETTLYSNKARPCVFNCIPINNATGFITKANTRYLKRDVVENGQRRYRSFYPVGPNVAWYSCMPYGIWERPLGIYDYERYIDSLAGNCNYMRIWLNRYQYLNLYGPEFTETPLGCYFDSTFNQKDAAELDCIVNYAAQNDIALMPCFFTFGDFCFQNPQEPNDPSVWSNNPYNTILNNPCQFFGNAEAQRVAKNLIRYIVARWGYATNIVSWELWNEVTNLPCEGYKPFEESVFSWHKIMGDYIREIDPFNHCITTSMSQENTYSDLYSNLYMYLDFVQRHDYQNINKAASNQQFSYILLNLSKNTHTHYSNKPFFVGEFGFGNRNKYNAKDPWGIDLHNSLWSSVFSTSMGPASFWWWDYLDDMRLFKRFNPIYTFCQNLPILSDSFEAFTTGEVHGYTLVFENNIETYFMKNETEDTIYGWAQDTAFCYQSLRRLTDSVNNNYHFVDNAVFDPAGYVYTLNPQKKPGPSDSSNIIYIPVSNIPVGTPYEVHWFNSETGLEYFNATANTSVHNDVLRGKHIPIVFPSFIRDLNSQTVTNLLGDVVFAIYQIDTDDGSEKNHQ